ncbi:butyrophilin subfamily 1 member A1-like [Emys orbicularis]|uniref:butyrophilin subfamily 1 member A1-like n=1 Tax=Emys orbicularis TaxID=82168 RepID=UPI0031FC9CA1
MTGKVPVFSPGSTVSSALPGYVALCLALEVHRLASAQFTVIGPDRPVTASLGGEAVLSCHLSPRMSAENMEVRWFQSQYSAVVHLYRDGQDQYRQQMPEYQGRTELLRDDITDGRVSLRIRDIRLFDEGQYTCFFQSSVTYEEALLELQVAGLGSAPVISVAGHQDRGIRVVCRSPGWYPQPEAQWRDLQGQLLPSVSENISREADGLFQAEIAIVLTEESNQKVSCCIKNPRLNQERESTIYVAELFFPRVNPWMVALAVILSLQAVLVALAGYCFWRQHREKGEVTRGRNLVTELAHDRSNQDKLQAELKWRNAQDYAVDVTLDPNTAHPNLVLSEDQKTVTYDDRRQDRPENPERFTTYPTALGANRFTGGKFYWEVEMGDKTSWTVGVCRESVIRTGKVRLTPGNGHWAVWLRDGKYEACTSPPRTPLPVSAMPSRVGIFLDYERGEVSFYNVTDRSHLFTFPDTFSGTLRPYFYVGYKEEGKNTAPLTICPVPAQAGGNLCP